MAKQPDVDTTEEMREEDENRTATKEVQRKNNRQKTDETASKRSIPTDESRSKDDQVGEKRER